MIKVLSCCIYPDYDIHILKKLKLWIIIVFCNLRTLSIRLHQISILYTKLSNDWKTMDCYSCLLILCYTQQSDLSLEKYQDRLLGSVPIERGLLVSIINSLSPTPFHLCRFKIYNEERQKMIRIERSFPKRERN